MISTASDIEQLAGRFGMPATRVARLYRLVGGRGDADLGLVERVLSRNTTDLARGLDALRCAPADVIARRGDGRDIKITLPSHTDTGTTRLDRGLEHADAMLAGYAVGIATTLQWDHRPGCIGEIVGTRSLATGDQEVWARLDDAHPEVTEQAVFGELGGSPAVGTRAPHRWSERGGRLVQEFTEVVPVVEVSLLPRGAGALPVEVELAAAPAYEREEFASLTALYLRGQRVW